MNTTNTFTCQNPNCGCQVDGSKANTKCLNCGAEYFIPDKADIFDIFTTKQWTESKKFLVTIAIVLGLFILCGISIIGL